MPGRFMQLNTGGKAGFACHCSARRNDLSRPVTHVISRIGKCGLQLDF